MRQCPECLRPLEAVDYVEYGRIVWDGKWTEKDWDVERMYSCPHCGVELTYSELIELGVSA